MVAEEKLSMRKRSQWCVVSIIVVWGQKQQQPKNLIMGYNLAGTIKIPQWYQTHHMLTNEKGKTIIEINILVFFCFGAIYWYFL